MTDDQAGFDDRLLVMLRAARPECAPRPAASPQAQALLERITAGQPAAAGRSWSARRAIRRLQRPLRPDFRRRRLVIAVAAVATAAALIVTGTLIGLGGSSTGPGGLRPGQVVSSAELLAKMTSSAAQVGSDVIKTSVARGGGYNMTVWRLGNIRPARTVYGRDGRTCYDIGETATQITVVDYLTRTWWVQPVPRGKVENPVFSGCSLTGFAALPMPLPAGGSLAWMGSWMRQFISQGYYRVDGRTVIDGQQVLILTAVTASNVSAREWVSASTYLPLRASLSVPSQHLSQVSSISYLPPTTANLAQLTIAIPAGFTHRHGTRPDHTLTPAAARRLLAPVRSDPEAEGDR